MWFSPGRRSSGEPGRTLLGCVADRSGPAYTFDARHPISFLRQHKIPKRMLGKDIGFRLCTNDLERLFFGSFSRQGKSATQAGTLARNRRRRRPYTRGPKSEAVGNVLYTKVKDEITYLPTADLRGTGHIKTSIAFSTRHRDERRYSQTDESTDLFASYTFTNSDIRKLPATFGRRRPVSLDRGVFGVPGHQFSPMVATLQRVERFWGQFRFPPRRARISPGIPQPNL